MEMFPSLILFPNEKARLAFRGVTFIVDEVTEPVEIRISVDPVDVNMNFGDVHESNRIKADR